MHHLLRRLAWLLPLLAMAACGGGEDRTKAHVRLVNATSGYSTLQLQVGDSNVGGAAAYGANEGYADVDKGTADASVSRPGSATVLSTTSVSLGKNSYYTMLAYGKAGQLATLLVDENEPKAADGKAKVRVVNAAPDAGDVDLFITASGDTLDDSSAALAGQAYGKLSGFATINSGTWRVRVTAAGDKTDVRLDVDGVVFAGNGVSTLVVTPGRGGVLVNALQLVQAGGVARQDNAQSRVRAVAGLAGGTFSVGVAGQALASDLVSPVQTDYSLVAAGTVAVAASAGGQAAALTSTTLAGGGDYTLLLYGTATAPVAVLVEDDNSRPTGSTKARVRLVHAVADVGGPLALTIAQKSIVSGVAQGAGSAYVEIAAPATADVGVNGNGTTLFTATDQVFAANTTYTVFAVGTAAATKAIVNPDR